MSKFANTFLKSLNEELEQEGNAFTRGLAKTKKGGKFKVGDKEVTDTSNYDDPSVKEKKMMPVKKKKAKKLHEAAGDEALPAPADDATGDREAYTKTLDKGTNPADFDVEDNPQLKVDSSGVEAARGWISKLEEMADFVNGTGPESLNSQINQLEIKNSVPFRGVVRREEKRITKLAENLRGLAEVFKSVIIGSQKKIQDATGPR